VRAGIDASSHAAENEQTARSQIAGKHLGNAAAAGRGMARADDGDRRTRQQLDIAAHPENRWGIVNLAETLRIGGAAVGEDRRAEGDARRFVFGCLTGLSIEVELRRLSGKAERFELAERDAEDLAGGIELFDGIENAFGAETRRESDRQPGKPFFIDRSLSEYWRGGSVHRGPWIAIGTHALATRKTNRTCFL
jgi:hypothetical protein